MKMRSCTAPPRRRGESQHHEALLLSSRGSGAAITGASADDAASAPQVLNRFPKPACAFGAHTQPVADDSWCMVSCALVHRVGARGTTK